MAEHSPSFDRTIVSMKLRDFLQWADESRELSENSLRLPPVQRSALWTPKQALDLWDSLLRGLPIGCFYLTESEAGNDCRPIGPSSGTTGTASSKMEKSPVRGFDLLDGQQRMRTMLLALVDPATEGRCLWIDPAGADEDRILPLRLTTASQPFGYDRNGGKLRLGERGRAREEFDRDNPDYSKADHRIFKEHMERHGFPPKPYKHPLAIPFRGLFKAWCADRSILTDYIRAQIGNDQTQIDYRQVAERIDGGLHAFDGAEVALIRVRADQNDLLRLFDRIGAGGTPLSGEERLYSIYKHHEPYVHNAIEAIHDAVGSVLPATKIAGCALRIASIETGKDSFDIPDVLLFSKRMAGDTDLKQKLRTLIPNDGSNGRLARVFSLLFRELDYRRGDDRGLPRVMVPELAPDLVHVLAFWIYLNACEEGNITPESRDEMIRFSLFWHLCCFNDTKASRHALKYLKDTRGFSPETSFPGKALYDLLTGLSGQDRCADSLFSPEKMRVYSDNARNEKSKTGWLSWKDRFDLVDPVQDLFRKWWHSGGKMLLWIQRSYFLEIFYDYDPCSGRDDDKPYDLDHVCPRATWLNSIYSGKNDDESLRKTASDGRYILGEGVGNLWWIDSRVNRSLGDASIQHKLGVQELESVIKAAFNEVSLPQWNAASVDENGWTAAARVAFQSAVEERTLWLYERFFDGLGFEAWLEARP